MIRWSEELWNECKDLSSSGYNTSAIAQVLGLTRDQVRHKLIREGLRAAGPRARKTSSVSLPKIRGYRTVSALRLNIPASAIDDRERRSAEPRTLTMELLGDPAPSQSALRRFCP